MVQGTLGKCESFSEDAQGLKHIDNNTNVICLFHSFSHKYTVEFDKSHMICEITTD